MPAKIKDWEGKKRRLYYSLWICWDLRIYISVKIHLHIRTELYKTNWFILKSIYLSRLVHYLSLSISLSLSLSIYIYIYIYIYIDVIQWNSQSVDVNIYIYIYITEPVDIYLSINLPRLVSINQSIYQWACFYLSIYLSIWARSYLSINTHFCLRLSFCTIDGKTIYIYIYIYTNFYFYNFYGVRQFVNKKYFTKLIKKE